ncbi:MAG: hypothetical protein OXR66_06235 [Candidatus Woesearchaeota archaeon]|nr:hypothetical protein [Candidatus Woesearchaeota archaeon]
MIDKLVYVAGLSSIIFTIPQVYVIWVQQTAAGVSLVSWSAYTAGASVWFTYGWVHKERPIIMTYACFFVLNLAVVLGVLRYG